MQERAVFLLSQLEPHHAEMWLEMGARLLDTWWTTTASQPPKGAKDK
jgi:hypothetical protein